MRYEVNGLRGDHDLQICTVFHIPSKKEPAKFSLNVFVVKI